MWNMMCDVMPTISEDSISQRSSQFSSEDANFEQLMVQMLDERDKLMDSLRETQERLGETEMKLVDVEKERDSLQRQIAANLPQVRLDRTNHLWALSIPTGGALRFSAVTGVLFIQKPWLFSTDRPVVSGRPFSYTAESVPS